MAIYTTISIDRDGRSAGFRHSGRDDAETMIKAIRQHADHLRAELALIDSTHDSEFRVVQHANAVIPKNERVIQEGEQRMVIRRYRVDYGFGIATIWIRESIETEYLSERVFMNYANQCFGLRKSISDFKILETETTNEFPGFWNKPETACVLKHNGDTIVWGYNGEKIKSEFD